MLLLLLLSFEHSTTGTFMHMRMGHPGLRTPGLLGAAPPHVVMHMGLLALGLPHFVWRSVLGRDAGFNAEPKCLPCRLLC